MGGFISRGFRGRKQDEGTSGRIPPGQHLTRDFPVLSAGPTPRSKLEDWTFTIEGDIRPVREWSWSEFNALPQTKVKVDIHCVTTWSKLDTNWEGVTLDDLFAAAGLDEPPAPYVMFECDGGYTTNVPVEDLLEGKAMIVTQYEGAPLQPEHGGPARVLVPHLYFWKSAKWVRSLRFMESDEPGFWESVGYHIYGDPWREQRYSGD